MGSEKRFFTLEVAVLVLIVGVLSLLTYEFVHPSLPLSTLWRFFLIDAGCCAVFLVEFFLRHHCAEDKIWYWKKNWVDFVASIPVPPRGIFPLRWARFVRLVRILRLFRALRLLFFVWRGMERLEQVADVKMMKKSIALILLIMVAGPIMFGLAERPEALTDVAVENAGERIWWTFTTVVTGGFADLYNPKGPLARVLTVLLVLAGIIVIGVFTATLTSIFFGEESDELRFRLDGLEEQVRELSESRPSD
jgi:hypothetical protein